MRVDLQPSDDALVIALSGEWSTSRPAPRFDLADGANLDDFRSDLKEMQDELAGTNGFDPIPNSKLNSFADYVVQSMEQADRTITVSVVTALLLLIIVILLV